MKAKKIFLIVCFFVLLVFSNILLAEQKQWVNILTWWGYLDDPRIKKDLENTCKVNVSYDEYYTNEQFLNSYNSHPDNYDILVFSNLVYPIVANKISQNNSALWTVSANYHPYFKRKYLEAKYSHNVVFFTHSMMGFLYNPKLQNITSTDDVISIFKNAKENYVILVDDPAENANLLHIGYSYKNKKANDTTEFNYEDFKKMTQNSTIYITNDFNKIYNLKNFAFSFIWSGDALLFLRNSKTSYKFTLHPQLSYICTDLLAQVRTTDAATCVARELSSPKIAEIVEKSTYYFTPYFKNNIQEDKEFSSLYLKTTEMLEKMNWIQPMSSKQFSLYSNMWGEIKIKINEKNDK